jgi:hypothetical protein
MPITMSGVGEARDSPEFVSPPDRPSCDEVGHPVLEWWCVRQGQKKTICQNNLRPTRDVGLRDFIRQTRLATSAFRCPLLREATSPDLRTVQLNRLPFIWTTTSLVPR